MNLENQILLTKWKERIRKVISKPIDTQHNVNPMIEVVNILSKVMS